ncbi:hypothetical protein [Bradyrhizobium cosmicum]|uniref:hypothetical protein n=1 Tax=Bradyrhizobium cosmicum TaxID=1404864 RepID=UPI0028EC7AAD|nr:hypothetical protein [Bradyrhizobium cosmicum]
MKALIAAAAVVFTAFFTALWPAVAQNTGPAPQTGMERPENTDGATEKGTMDTTGANVSRANQSEAKQAGPKDPKDDARKGHQKK